MAIDLSRTSSEILPGTGRFASRMTPSLVDHSARSHSDGGLSTSRVAFAINGRFLSQRITGVQRYAREITAQLDQLAALNSISAVLEIPQNQAESVTYSHLVESKSSKFSGHIWEQFVLPFAADLRVTHLPLLNLCNLGPVISRRQVVCIHDANVFQAPDSYSRFFRHFYQLILPVLARRATAVTTVSTASARSIATYLPVAEQDILVLPNGHEHVHRWNAAKSKIFEKYPATRPYILLLGSRAPHKNMKLIFDLATALDQLGIEIRVTGSPASIFAGGDVDQRARASNILYLGYVSDDDLAALFEKASCLVFPSFTEGFGLPIVEAMALGCRSYLPIGQACRRFAAMRHYWLRRISPIYGWNISLRWLVLQICRRSAAKKVS